MSSRTVGALLCGIAIGAMGFASASAADSSEVKGKVAKADAAKGTLTITKQDGTEQTFKVTNDTKFVGPRNGAVPQRLNDKRFAGGVTVTVIANEDTAKEVHLGTLRIGGRMTRSTSGFRSNLKVEPAPENTSGKTTPATTTPAAPTKPQATEEANEVTGTIKSVNARQRTIVVTAADGTDHSFIVGRATKVSIGDAVSEKGLADSQLKPGMSVTVTTEGRRVKEVKATVKSLKKAG